MIKLIYLTSIFLLSYSFNQEPNFTHGLKKTSKIKNQGLAFYTAAQTGDKQGLKKSIKNRLNEFGLIHLLTPSGIHLSAILGLFLIFTPMRFQIFVYFILIVVFWQSPALYSLKRVLYFRIIMIFVPHLDRLKISFLLTFLLDILIGGFSASPLSFSYSFLFWGSIIFSPKKSFVIYKNLFFAQIIAMVFGQNSLNFFSLVINPLFTSLYSIGFPLFSLNFWIIKSNFLDNHIISFHHLFITIVAFLSSKLSFAILAKSSYWLLLPFLPFRKKWLFSYLLFFSLDLNLHRAFTKEQTVLYSLPDKTELIFTKKNNQYYLDYTCKKDFAENYWEIMCKKKPSQFGGPSF